MLTVARFQHDFYLPAMHHALPFFDTHVCSPVGSQHACHVQVLAAAEAFRMKFLQARKGSADEHLLWISGSRSQAAAEVMDTMTGGLPMHCGR